ncbi:HyaD/HybD family hydrogenase maturation endopeptidase [Paraburkholderia phymatum]|uniref:HyaD/HybD family hydrogenase maturation endopeptidase n=1 Tax=Paraburkholderia phymatum TaxID=148447 RepID=A0ACC6UAZ0_9BURK
METTTAHTLPHIVVLGIGNVLWADEGFGVRAVERLNALWHWPEHVELVDGGTQGLALLSFVESADRLIVFDAVDFGLEPGTLAVREGDAVPACLSARKMSLHQAGFSDVLACAQLKGNYPDSLVLIGVQPVELNDFGGSLRLAVRTQIEPAIAVAGEWLRRWSAFPVTHADRDAPVSSLNANGLALSRYESERPSPQSANRHGDTRFWHPSEPC